MRTLILTLLLLSNVNFSVELDGTTNVSYKDYTQRSKSKESIVVLNKNQEHKATTAFNRKMRKRESPIWTKVNQYGYIGTYQFGRSALIATGYGHITVDSFKINPYIWPPEEQEKAMNRLIKINKKILAKFIEEYKGDTIKGIVVTEHGLLAAAHLGGAGGTIKFLKSKGTYDPEDANGTHISTYLREFADL